MSISDNARKVFADLTGRGLPPHLAAGLVGNIIQESGAAINTGAVGDGGNSFGMVQWNGPRKRAFLDYAASRGKDPSDLEVQTDYMLTEFAGPERKAFEAIMGARDPQEAAVIASQKFWRPGDPRNENRAKYAAQVYAQLAGDTMTDASPAPAQAQAIDRAAIIEEARRRGLIVDGPRVNQLSPEALRAEAQRRGIVLRDPRAPTTTGGAMLDAAGGVAQALQQGVFMGQGDRLGALSSATVGSIKDAVTGSENAPGFWDRYQQSRDNTAARRERLNEALPGAAPAAEIVGAVAPALASGGTGLAAQLSRLTPAAQVARLGAGGQTTAGQIGRAALAGGVGGALYASGQDSGNVADALTNVAGGAATGAAFGVAGRELAILAGRVISALGRSPAVTAAGDLTDEARAVLSRNGIDPDQIGDQFMAALRARVGQASGATDEAARMAVADEFGIPLTRGQATGDMSQIAFEEAARNQARGAGAAATVRGIDDAARGRAREFADQFARKSSPQDSALASAEGLRDALKAQAGRAKAGYQAAYAAADASDAVVDVSAFGGLKKRAQDALQEVTFAPTPQAKGALRAFDDFVANASAGPEGTVGVQFQAVETLRKKLNGIMATAEGIEAREVGALIRTLDDWTEETIDGALISGSDDALALIKEARSQFRAFKTAYGAGKPGDDAARVINKMVERDVTAEEVANWLWGAHTIGASGTSVRVVEKLRQVLPPETFGEIRAGAWRRVTEKTGGGEYGTQALSSRLDQFTTGNGSTLAKALFTPAELAQMKRFSAALKIMTPPPGATNPSKTAYGIARLGQDVARAMTTAMGFAQGGVAGGIGAQLAGAAASSLPNAARAAAIAAPKPLPSPSARIQRGAGVAAGAVAGPQSLQTIQEE